MNILAERANIKIDELKRYTLVTTSKELGLLSEPCYYPDVKKYYYELLNLTGLTDADVKDSTKQFFKDLPAEQWKLESNPYSNLLIFIMNYFLLHKELTGYNSTMLLYTIMNYSNLMNKYIKYCNKNVFKYTLDNISKNHIFRREQTISNALFFFAKDFQRLHTTAILKRDAEGVVRFIRDTRTRLNQSVRGFASVYYENSEKGLEYRTIIEPTGEEKEDEFKPKEVKQTEIKSVNNVSRNIAIYKIVDNKALEAARNLTKISKGVSVNISKCICKPEYVNNIKLILELFVKNLKTSKDLCGINFFTLVKKEMAIKRTVSKVYFKKEVNNLLMAILDECKLKKEYESYSIQTKFYVNLFLAYYLTLYLRNSVC